MVPLLGDVPAVAKLIVRILWISTKFQTIVGAITVSMYIHWCFINSLFVFCMPEAPKTCAQAVELGQKGAALVTSGHSFPEAVLNFLSLINDGFLPLFCEAEGRSSQHMISKKLVTPLYFTS